MFQFIPLPLFCFFFFFGLVLYSVVPSKVIGVVLDFFRRNLRPVYDLFSSVAFQLAVKRSFFCTLFRFGFRTTYTKLCLTFQKEGPSGGWKTRVQPKFMLCREFPKALRSFFTHSANVLRTFFFIRSFSRYCPSWSTQKCVGVVVLLSMFCSPPFVHPNAI